MHLLHWQATRLKVTVGWAAFAAVLMTPTLGFVAYLKARALIQSCVVECRASVTCYAKRMAPVSRKKLIPPMNRTANATEDEDVPRYRCLAVPPKRRSTRSKTRSTFSTLCPNFSTLPGTLVLPRKLIFINQRPGVAKEFRATTLRVSICSNLPKTNYEAHLCQYRRHESL